MTDDIITGDHVTPIGRAWLLVARALSAASDFCSRRAVIFDAEGRPTGRFRGICRVCPHDPEAQS